METKKKFISWQKALMFMNLSSVSRETGLSHSTLTAFIKCNDFESLKMSTLTAIAKFMSGING